MVDFLKDIYKYANMIFDIKRAIQQARYGFDANIRRLWSNITPDIVDFCKLIQDLDYSLGTNIYSEIIKATSYTSQEIEDYISFSDTLDYLIPDLYKAISLLGQINESSNKYLYSSSKIGFLSLIDIRTKKKLNSSIDPMWEAYEHAQKIYSPTMMAYHFINIDLGYLPYQIYMLSNRSIDVYIYSLSQDMIDNAVDFGVLSWISEAKLHVIISDDPMDLLSKFISLKDSYNSGYYFHPLAEFSFPNDFATFIKENYVENINHYYLEDIKTTNFYRNITNVPEWIDSFKPKHSSQEWAILVGGPSLDSQLDYIKEHRAQFTLLCASTVLKKLIDSGIFPDCVVTFDPQNRTYDHFKDLFDFSTPLLLGSIGNWQFGEYYSGPKFLIPCETSYEVNNLLKSYGLNLWTPGSTVSTLAIKIAIYFSANTIRLFGYDLSYPNQKSHAEGTADYTKVTYDDMHLVTSVNGSNVYTTPTFHYYLNEIAEIVKENDSIVFINHSDEGAYIPGTSWYKALDAKE